VQFPITIGLRRSRFLDGFIGLSLLLASGAILAFPRSTLIQAMILCSIGFFAALAWRRLKPRFSAIRLEHSGEISLLCAADQVFVLAEILPGATVHPWLTVVRLKTEDGSPLTLIVTVDSLKAADFRCLRVFLRWRADFNGLNDDA
jgi:toxin CptA